MPNRFSAAVEEIEAAKKRFSEAEKNGREALKHVLEPVGEHGVTIANIGDNRGEMRVATAEVNYADIRPIALIRYSLLIIIATFIAMPPYCFASPMSGFSRQYISILLVIPFFYQFWMNSCKIV